jgi:transposase
LDENGKEIKYQKIRGHWDSVLKSLAKLKKPWSVCFEASCGYGVLYDRLSRMASRVTVGHPGQLRLIFRSKRKHDRIDARKLAKLLYLDEVPPVYVPAGETRSWRQLIEYRRHLVDKRTRTKNGLRSLLRSFGIVAPPGLWTRKGLVWLASAAWPNELAACQRDMLLEELRHFDQQVARVTKVLDEMGSRHPGVALLQTIPGVGPRTAEAVVAYIDDPQRFARNRQVGAYFGLVPCEDSSAGAHRLGHITKEGPSSARKLLIEASWQVIRRCPAMRAFFERIAGGKPDRRKIALVATGHRLLRCMLAMLQSGEVWRPAA